ncbi:hypothetical protein CEUSTIGMA_g4356.t1 [Chlamydomonas eustigma]|uniref:Uncharacterized protein n=1 Tax=Chlamydomonas eustigma TaxID=1157962 RepID=A0A250X2D9_9CHLO|nr:hypothetical protein CEUSTIGMA_g4356.t1 [Chlamydomonas eustigma]|eukprot:GAX76910.1 hypothetical protein CEUSTIGMA_g4356.t1 [Chlamydomonas eustigma]
MLHSFLNRRLIGRKDVRSRGPHANVLKNDAFLAHSWGGGRGRGRGGNDFGELILGPNGGRGMSRQGDPRAPKLIIPGGRGNSPPTGAPGQLIMPEEGMGVTGMMDIGDSVTTPTPPSRYRPPAGFMNEDGLLEDETSKMSPEEMMNRLRTRAGQWHMLAKCIPSLYKLSYTSANIDEISGITPSEQSRWVVASTIHDSLRLSGKVPPDVMAAFEDGGDELLFPFRYVAVEYRVAAALYIVENRLSPDDCEVLARAMKEWDRRLTERYGFSEHPGDCLAFKYMRDALETRSKSELVKRIEQGLKVAVTDGARARLEEVLKEADELTSAVTSSAASIVVLRLNEDEIGTRAMPILGTYAQVTMRDVESAPRATMDGAFGVFSLVGTTAAQCKWVTLPMWKALSLAKHPAAIEVPDCSRVSSILLGTKSKSDDDRKRLQGPGILVLDVGSVAPYDANPSTFYLASGTANETLEVVDAAALVSMGKHAVATILFLCRPPLREGMASPSTSSGSDVGQLLQL